MPAGALLGEGGRLTILRHDGLPMPRPRAVTAIGYLFMAAGAVGFVYHVTELRIRNPIDLELLAVLMIRLLAIVSGAFMLRGANWARWLALVWVAYHVLLSARHSMSEMVTHLLLLSVVSFLLLRPDAASYFRGPSRL